MEPNDRDQTDEVLKDKFYAYAENAPETVFKGVAKKRSEKRRRFLFWNMGIAALVILAAGVYYLQKPVAHKSTAQVQIKQESNQRATSATSPQIKSAENKLAEDKPEAQLLIASTPKISTPVFHNEVLKHVAVSKNKAGVASTPSMPPPSEKKAERNLSQSTSFTNAANSFSEITSEPPSFPETKKESTFAALAKDSLPVQVCDEVIIPDSIVKKYAAATQKKRAAMFLSLYYTQNVWNTLLVKNDESILVFGDSNTSANKPIGGYTAGLQAGFEPIPHWQFALGFQWWQIRYAHIAQAEKQQMHENLSVAIFDPNLYLSPARYYDEWLRYWQIPADISYVHRKGVWEFNAGGGPLYTRLMKTSTYVASVSLSDLPQQENQAAHERFNRQFFSVHLHGAASYQILPRTFVSAGFSFQHLLKPAFNNNYYSQEKSNVLGMQLGLKFYF